MGISPVHFFGLRKSTGETPMPPAIRYTRSDFFWIYRDIWLSRFYTLRDAVVRLVRQISRREVFDA